MGPYVALTRRDGASGCQTIAHPSGHDADGLLGRNAVSFIRRPARLTDRPWQLLERSSGWKTLISPSRPFLGHAVPRYKVCFALCFPFLCSGMSSSVESKSRRFRIRVSDNHFITPLRSLSYAHIYFHRLRIRKTRSSPEGCYSPWVRKNCRNVLCLPNLAPAGLISPGIQNAVPVTQNHDSRTVSPSSKTSCTTSPAA